MENKRITKPQLAFQYCKEIAKSINECVLRTIALQVLKENEEIFLTIKGSDWQHHNYAGGLIVHTCNVTLNAIRLGEFYGDSVNMDMIKFCSLMHDVGKLFDYEKQNDFVNEHAPSMNQALLGHSFEGANYVVNLLQKEYEKDSICVSKEYSKKVITQVAHCIGAHMHGFGACAKQQMYEVVIINCADKVDAYLEQTIVRNDKDSFVIGTGETFYKASADAMKIVSVKNILRDDLH